MINGKLQSFQGLRSLATVGIFLFHAGFLLQGTFPVTLFFMLSGFLVYYTKHELVDIVTFKDWIIGFVGRKLRSFYPLHLITFIGSLLIGDYLTKSIDVDTVLSGILNLFLIHPFFEQYAFSFNGLSWYLAVTIFLYSIGYYLIKFVDTIKIDLKIIIIITFLIIIFFNAYNRFYSYLYLYTNPCYRILDFLLGILVSKVFVENKLRIKNYSMIELSLVLVFVLQYLLSLVIKEDHDIIVLHLLVHY